MKWKYRGWASVKLIKKERCNRSEWSGIQKYMLGSEGVGVIMGGKC